MLELSEQQDNADRILTADELINVTRQLHAALKQILTESDPRIFQAKVALASLMLKSDKETEKETSSSSRRWLRAERRCAAEMR